MFSERQKILGILAVLVVLIAADVYISTILQPSSHISVNEGYESITIPYPPKYVPENKTIIGLTYHKNASAVTEINNGSGYLNFTVKVVSGYDDMGTVTINAFLIANCNLPSDLKPTGFKFEGIVSNSPGNCIDLLEAFNEGTNATTSHSKYIFEGEDANHNIDGFDVNGNVFSAKTLAEWDIGYGKPYTLRLNAVILGLPKEVKATVDISMEGN